MHVGFAKNYRGRLTPTGTRSFSLLSTRTAAENGPLRVGWWGVAHPSLYTYLGHSSSSCSMISLSWSSTWHEDLGGVWDCSTDSALQTPPWSSSIKNWSLWSTSQLHPFFLNRVHGAETVWLKNVERRSSKHPLKPPLISLTCTTG
jgi:hypothetical protein